MRLWDVASGKELRKFTGHTEAVSSVDLSLDGKWAASGGGDNSLRLWEVATGKELRKLPGPFGFVQGDCSRPTAGTSSPWSDDKTIRLWDVETGTEIRKFVGHTQDIASASFLPGSANQIVSIAT